MGDGYDGGRQGGQQHSKFRLFNAAFLGPTTIKINSFSLLSSPLPDFASLLPLSSYFSSAPLFFSVIIP